MTDHALQFHRPALQPEPPRSPRLLSGVWRTPFLPRLPRKDRGQTPTQRLRLAGRVWTTVPPPPTSQRGEALTEFALLAPVLVLFLFGILEMGRVVDASIVVQNAAREGARAGAVSPGPVAADATSAASAYLANAVSMRTDIAMGPVTANQPAADVVAVTTRVDVTIYTPIVSSVLGGATAPVSATVSMRRQ